MTSSTQDGTTCPHSLGLLLKLQLFFLLSSKFVISMNFATIAFQISGKKRSCDERAAGCFDLQSFRCLDVSAGISVGTSGFAVIEEEEFR